MNNYTPEDMTAKLREYIGTPYHSGGRVKGQGVDCAGLFVCALNELGIYAGNTKVFSRFGDFIESSKMFMAEDSPVSLLHLGSYTQNKTLPKEGDVAIIRDYPVFYHHMVYFTEKETIIHAWGTPSVMKVTESVMLPDWWDKIHSVWRFKDLD